MTQRQQLSTAEQQAQSANQVHPNYASAENSDGVVFSKGNMVVNGTAQMPSLAQQWESSNGLTVYTTVTWNHPHNDEKRVSCNCPGWTIKKPGKPRRCKHTDDMMGIARCGDRKVDTARAITTVAQAEEIVPKFDGRLLRSIEFD